MKMKHFNKFLAAGLLVLGSATVNAQATASATATATIVSPITITKVTDLNFGNIAVDAVGGGTLELTPGSTRIPSGGVTLPGTTGTVSAASFTVTGTSGFTYSITLPADIMLTHSLGMDQMQANNIVSTPNGAGTLVGGTDVINVGATLDVPPAATPGVYTNPGFDVTVNYN
jgi:hypothetical protein